MSLLLLAKITLLFAAALAASILAKHSTAATRHALLTGAQLAALILPLLASIVPPLRILPTHTQPPHITTPATTAATPTDPRTPPPVPHPPSSNLHLLTIAWLTGLTLIALTKLTSHLRAMSLARRTPGLFSDEVDQPVTIGRRILLPSSAKRWSDERLRIVLLHEEAHAARRDTLVALIGDIACAVYWFHPLTWLVARRARLERERACDDLVLAAGVAASDYATAMLDVARAMARGGAAAMPMAEVSQIETRIRAILDPRTRRRSAHALAALATIVAAAPLLAAIDGVFPRPRAIEPDLLGDFVASPFSERVDRMWKTGDPACPDRQDCLSPTDAALYALLRDAASRSPRSSIDFVPERARWALTRVHDRQLVTPLLESLHDADWRIRTYAAWALGYSHDARATAPVAALLDEPIWRVRAMAAHALANLADPAAESVMLDHLGDDAWQVRLEVVRYLKAVGGHRAELDAMRSDRHMAVRGAASE